jgi:hypothetical protein
MENLSWVLQVGLGLSMRDFEEDLYPWFHRLVMHVYAGCTCHF